MEEPHQATAAVITEDEGIDWRLRSLDVDGGKEGTFMGWRGLEWKRTSEVKGRRGHEGRGMAWCDVGR